MPGRCWVWCQVTSHLTCLACSFFVHIKELIPASNTPDRLSYSGLSRDGTEKSSADITGLLTYDLAKEHNELKSVSEMQPVKIMLNVLEDNNRRSPCSLIICFDIILIVKSCFRCLFYIFLIKMLYYQNVCMSSNK